MSYYAYLKQDGGCDYTIGCGNLLIKLKATNPDMAIIELKDLIKTNYCGELSLSSVILYESTEIAFDVNEVYKEQKEEQEETKRKEIERTEKSEFERLKKKYE